MRWATGIHSADAVSAFNFRESKCYTKQLRVIETSTTWLKIDEPHLAEGEGE